jgi:hypothetical protein
MKAVSLKIEKYFFQPLNIEIYQEIAPMNSNVYWVVFITTHKNATREMKKIKGIANPHVEFFEISNIQEANRFPRKPNNPPIAMDAKNSAAFSFFRVFLI